MSSFTINTSSIALGIRGLSYCPHCKISIHVFQYTYLCRYIAWMCRHFIHVCTAWVVFHFTLVEHTVCYIIPFTLSWRWRERHYFLLHWLNTAQTTSVSAPIFNQCYWNIIYEHRCMNHNSVSLLTSWSTSLLLELELQESSYIRGGIIVYWLDPLKSSPPVC